jgi:hypothetical protein
MNGAYVKTEDVITDESQTMRNYKESGIKLRKKRVELKLNKK